jgi:hypothetical protein
MPKLKVKFRIPQKMIIEGNVSRIAAYFSPGLIPTGELASRCNSLCVELVYPAKKTRALYAVAEVRHFLKRLHRAWPYCAYFCSFETDFLLVQALCQLRNLAVIEDEKSRSTAVGFLWAEMWKFLLEGRRSIEKLGTAAGMTRRQIRRRQDAFCRYFMERLPPLGHQKRLY